MTLEELERLEKGKRLMQKISKLKEFLADLDKTEINVIYTPPAGKNRYAKASNLMDLVGKDFMNDRVKGDLMLAVSEEIVKLEEEFNSL
jgi:hypothetical protein